MDKSIQIAPANRPGRFGINIANIAIVSANSTNVGNCSASACVNLFGIQLLGPQRGG